jgi:Predicted membrane protein
MNTKNQKIKKLAQTGLFAALCFVAFTFLKIRIPIPGGDSTSLHVGNAFCVLAALILGGLYGGLAGSLGMTIADLLDPEYIIAAPKTFVLKLCIGLITGLVAHRYAKINNSESKGYVLKWATIASICGLAFNVIFDPVVGYFYKQYILGQPQKAAEILAKFSAAATLVNAVVSVILVNIIYSAIMPTLKRLGFLLADDNNK